MPEGSRKFLTTLVFGVLSLAALVIILLLKQFTPAVFTAWITGTAAVFTGYQAANVVSKFSPQSSTPESVVDSAEKPKPPELGGDGIFGLSGRNKKKLTK